MNKLIFLFLSLIITSCVSLVPKKELNMWALSNGYILSENCPKIIIPERQSLPHPEIPIIHIKDAKGNYIQITQPFLMKTIITLFGTIDKFQHLVEIYEREYLNSGGKIMPDLSLDDLKKIYLERIRGLDTAYPSTSSSTYPSTSTSTTTLDINISDFIILVEAFNLLQYPGE